MKPKPAKTKKIISDDPVIGKYKNRSDGRTYEVTHIEKNGDDIVCGHGINTKTGKGIIRMNREQWEKNISFGLFERKKK